MYRDIPGSMLMVYWKIQPFLLPSRINLLIDDMTLTSSNVNLEGIIFGLPIHRNMCDRNDSSKFPPKLWLGTVEKLLFP